MKLRTLLAVTLATAAPAAAGPEHDHSQKPAVSTPKSAPRANPATHAGTAPRTLPTGSPACGNVQGKMPTKRRAEIEACLRAEAAKAPPATTGVAAAPMANGAPTTGVAAKPRTLPTGSPACGNVQAKLPSSKRAEIEACLRAEAAKLDASRAAAKPEAKK
jgi:hypothetical protein